MPENNGNTPPVATTRTMPVKFSHDPNTGLVIISNPVSAEGIHLVNPPTVTCNEDLIVAIAMRITAGWLGQRGQIDMRMFNAPQKPGT